MTSVVVRFGRAIFVLAILLSLSARTNGQEGPAPDDRNFLLGQVLMAIDHRAQILSEQGKPEEALEELRRILTIEIPKDHPAYEIKVRVLGRIAMAYAQSGKRKEAIESLQRLLADVPPKSVAEASAYLDVGQVYRSLGMADEALKAYEKAIELSQKLAQNPPRRPRPMGPPPSGNTGPGRGPRGPREPAGPGGRPDTPPGEQGSAPHQPGPRR